MVLIKPQQYTDWTKPSFFFFLHVYSWLCLFVFVRLQCSPVLQSLGYEWQMKLANRWSARRPNGIEQSALRCVLWQSPANRSVVLVGSGVISIGLKKLKKENCNCFKICSVFIPNHKNNVIKKYFGLEVYVLVVFQTTDSSTWPRKSNTWPIQYIPRGWFALNNEHY